MDSPSHAHQHISRVLSPVSSPSTARRFDDRDRASIISTSTKGWAPLNTKRPSSVLAPPSASGAGSPARATTTTTTTGAEGPRRTSSSFKHVRHNNLVSNSIFKSGSPSLGSSGSSPRISQGRKVSTGKASSQARKVSSTGTRKVSGTRNTVKAGSTPRKPSLTEDLRTSNGASPSRKPTNPAAKGSTGLTGLAEGGYVSRSPFLQQTASFEGSLTPASPSSGSPGMTTTSSAKANVRGERYPSPDRRAADRSSPSIIRSDAVHPATTAAESPAALLEAESIAHYMQLPTPSAAPAATVSPGKSSLTSRRLRGPRLSDPSSTQVYGSTTFTSSSGSSSRRLAAPGKTVTFRDVADVKEFQADSSGGEWEDDGDYEEGESWDEVLLGPPGAHHLVEQDHSFQEEAFTENTPSPEMDLSGLKRYGSLNSRPATTTARSPLQRERGPAYASQEREEEEGYAGYVAQLEHQHQRQHQQHQNQNPQQGYDDESTTANFIDSLYADGYLSPPGSQGGVSASGTFEGLAAVLEGDTRAGKEVDEYGIPLGRKHHADRAAEAHAVVGHHHGENIPQPALPRSHADEGVVGEAMLRTGDARKPATALAREQYGDTVSAHQDGQFVDPFVTIQTATRVSAIDYHGAQQPSAQREEDGVPLGRTSHAERAKVARQLATRGLGLGMPARPMVPFVMGGMRGREGESGSEDEYDDRGYSIPELSKLAAEPVEEQHHPARQHEQPAVSLAPIVSPFPQQTDGEMNPVDQAGSISKRALPKPPKPTPVMGMPRPVEKSENQRESRQVPEERVTSPTKVFGLSLPFSLPALSSTTSPLFAGGPGFSKAASESGSEGSADHDLYDQDEREPSLTPPPINLFGRQPESPHHIPEFDFESPSRNPRQRHGSDDEDPTSEAFRLVEDALPKLSLDASGSGEKNDVKSRLSGLFGERRDVQSSDSGSSDGLNHDRTQTSSRVRPRISKDVIRARLEEKRSMNSLVNSKPMPGKHDDVFLSPARRNAGQDKDTLQNQWLGDVNSPVRPGLRSRQDTMSAEEVLQSVPEPKSALEQLVCNFTFTEFDEFAQASSSSPDRESFKLQPATGAHIVRHATSENVLGNKVRSSQRLALSPSGLPQIEEASTPDMTANEQDITLGQELNAGGRPKRRRSMSTGDARARAPLGSSTIDNRMSLLDTFNFENSTSILSAFEKELNERQSVKPYTVREHKTVYASADDKVKHNIAGDVDKGRAWRQLRKASDINQYAKEIKAMKAKASNSAKSFGTIFVKVLGIESLNLPLPREETSFCITLDNGIDYIRTPYTTLKDSAKVNQEFALVEHANFEFALGLEIRRDSHINKMIQANANPAQPAFRPGAGSRASVMMETASIQSSASRGLKSLFSSPRKMSKAPKMVIPDSASDGAPSSAQDNLARYFTDGDSTVGRTHIAFKPIAKNCDARLLEIRYPMFGMHQAPAPASASMPVATSTHRGARHSVQTLPRPAPPPAPVRKQVCKITLQIFRLPPLPGLTDEQLPQSIDECLRGMRHHAWHEHEYHQGVLTQRGGDCVAPRRRPFKLIGGNLVASNAVTNKTVFSIDLRKAKALVDENDDAAGAGEKRKKSLEEELEAGYSKMPRSFTLRFEDDDSITFWTDTDDEKAGWMKALGSLIGKVPSNPLWAELLAARQRHLKAKSASRASLAAIANEPATDAPPVPSK